MVDDPNEVGEDERMFEIAARNVVDPETATGKTFSWGIPATNERVLSHFTVSASVPIKRVLSLGMPEAHAAIRQNYDSRIREALAQVPEGQWREFSAFAGPRLEKLSAWDKVVLLGDASHPLSGKSCPLPGQGRQFTVRLKR